MADDALAAELDAKYAEAAGELMAGFAWDLYTGAGLTRDELLAGDRATAAQAAGRKFAAKLATVSGKLVQQAFAAVFKKTGAQGAAQQDVDVGAILNEGLLDAVFKFVEAEFSDALPGFSPTKIGGSLAARPSLKVSLPLAVIKVQLEILKSQVATLLTFSSNFAAMLTSAACENRSIYMQRYEIALKMLSLRAQTEP